MFISTLEGSTDKKQRRKIQRKSHFLCDLSVVVVAISPSCKIITTPQRPDVPSLKVVLSNASIFDPFWNGITNVSSCEFLHSYYRPQTALNITVSPFYQGINVIQYFYDVVLSINTYSYIAWNCGFERENLLYYIQLSIYYHNYVCIQH